MPHIQDPSSSPNRELPDSESSRTQRIRIKNRRKLYLDRHPSYFTSPDLELADPLLYDRCIRRFQSAAEREADGRAKGYSGVLEADLYRSEAKIAALHNEPDSSSSTSVPRSSDSDIPFVTRRSYARGEGGEGVVLPEEEDEKPRSREEGMERWRFEMTLRFLRGRDGDFDYGLVDESEEFDVLEGREVEERWFEDEEPEWVGAGEEDGVEKGKGMGTSGETGVQDF